MVWWGRNFLLLYLGWSRKASICAEGSVGTCQEGIGWKKVAGGGKQNKDPERKAYLVCFSNNQEPSVAESASGREKLAEERSGRKLISYDIKSHCGRGFSSDWIQRVLSGRVHDLNYLKRYLWLLWRSHSVCTFLARKTKKWWALCSASYQRVHNIRGYIILLCFYYLITNIS